VRRAAPRAEGACCRAILLIRAALLAFLALSVLVVGFFSYFYVKYDRIIEQRFRDPVFTTQRRSMRAANGAGGIGFSRCGNRG